MCVRLGASLFDCVPSFQLWWLQPFPVDLAGLQFYPYIWLLILCGIQHRCLSNTNIAIWSLAHQHTNTVSFSLATQNGFIIHASAHTVFLSWKVTFQPIFWIQWACCCDQETGDGANSSLFSPRISMMWNSPVKVLRCKLLVNYDHFLWGIKAFDRLQGLRL